MEKNIKLIFGSYNNQNVKLQHLDFVKLLFSYQMIMRIHIWNDWLVIEIIVSHTCTWNGDQGRVRNTEEINCGR